MAAALKMDHLPSFYWLTVRNSTTTLFAIASGCASWCPQNSLLQRNSELRHVLAMGHSDLVQWAHSATPAASLSTCGLSVHLRPPCPPAASLPTCGLPVHLRPACPPAASLPTCGLPVHLRPPCPPAASLSTVQWMTRARQSAGTTTRPASIVFSSVLARIIW